MNTQPKAPPVGLIFGFAMMIGLMLTLAGLVLPLTSDIIQKHPGCLEVDSEVGKGSVFRVTLPIEHVAEAEND
jgi:nitrogen-specific signal transduction histidine kinase